MFNYYDIHFTDGFKNKDFLTKYNGNYSIEIHSRTNAIGMPIQTHNIANSYIYSELNMNELFTADPSLSPKEKRINVSYTFDYLENIGIRLTGKILNLIYVCHF